MQMSAEDKRSLIGIRLQMLIALFNKKVSEQSMEALTRVFCTALENFPEGAITKGFGKAEQGLERFPTPKLMREICGECMPPQTWRYRYEPGTDADGVACLIDPDPQCENCQESRSRHPMKKCTQFRGEQFMYRPQDCAEGRAFLRKLAEVVKRDAGGSKKFEKRRTK